METRRNFLKLAAMLSGAAGVSDLIPEAVARAYAIEPPAGSTYLDAEHIVILMQENRSFDHELGTLQGVRGFGGRTATRFSCRRMRRAIRTHRGD
jgi:phospholipase C